MSIFTQNNLQLPWLVNPIKNTCWRGCKNELIHSTKCVSRNKNVKTYCSFLFTPIQTLGVYNFFKEHLFLVPNSRILIILIGLINTIQIQGNLYLQGSWISTTRKGLKKNPIPISTLLPKWMLLSLFFLCNILLNKKPHHKLN